MADKLILNDVTVDSARRAILNGCDAVDLRPLYGLEWAQSPRLRRARDSASNYASGAFALVTHDLMRQAEQLLEIARDFRELEDQMTPPVSTATGRKPV